MTRRTQPNAHVVRWNEIHFTKLDPLDGRCRLGAPVTDALYFQLKDRYPRSNFDKGPVFEELWALAAQMERELIAARKVHSRTHEIVTIVRAVARPLGYSIAVHGSLSRDLDLVATPWSETACSARTLAWNVMRALEGFVVVRLGVEPSRKPHGRLAWSIHTKLGFYVDLSVSPRGKQPWWERAGAVTGKWISRRLRREWFWGQPWWSKAWNWCMGRRTRRGGCAASEQDEG